MLKIQYCPHCGQSGFKSEKGHRWQCPACGFEYFHNVASAVAGMLICGDQVLLAQRKFDPGKGLWDLPGGFVDYDESLEQAMAREAKEELGVSGLTWQYLVSFPNRYLYKGVLYRTQDAFFKAEVAQRLTVQPQDDVAEALWVPIADISLEEVAFSSVRQALAQLQLGQLGQLS